MNLLKRIAWFLAGVLLPAAALAGQSANGDRLIVVTYWGDDKVALVDTQGEAGKEEVWSLDLLKTAGCAKPYDVRVNRRGSHAFVSCSGNDEIAVVDIVAQLVEYKIKTGRSPRDLQLYQNDSRLIVANSGADTVSIVDVGNRRVLYDIPVALQPYGVSVTSDGSTAAVTGWASGDLHILALGATSGSVTSKVRVGMLPYTVVTSADGKMAYVAANGSHAIVAVDMARSKVVTAARVGRNPWSIATSPDTKTLLVANNRSGDLSVLRTGAAPTAALMKPLQISAGAQVQPNGSEIARAAKNVAMTSNGKTGVFTDLANNQVVVIELPSGAIRKVINVGKAPYGIEFIRPPGS